MCKSGAETDNKTQTDTEQLSRSKMKVTFIQIMEPRDRPVST